MGAPPPRVRYNAKARGSVAGSSGKRGKPKKPQRTNHSADGDNDDEVHNTRDDAGGDPNPAMIIPPTKEQIELSEEAQKKAKIKAEVKHIFFTLWVAFTKPMSMKLIAASSESKMSNKKKRKLDSYIVRISVFSYHYVCIDQLL